MPEQTKASIGASKRFECRVVGFPRPTVTWFKDGRDISHNDRFEFDYSIDGIVTMVIHKVTLTDQGVYSCRAENSEGWAATAAILHVRAVQGYKDQETVHEMKFEVGGSKIDQSEICDQTDQSQVKIKSRYDDFISKIGGKGSIHDSIRSDVDNGDFTPKIKSKLTENETDNGKESWTASTDTDISSSVKDKNGYNIEFQSEVDAGAKNQTTATANDQEMLRPSSKRRLSDLDVHLRMMNEKHSPFFNKRLGEEGEEEAHTAEENDIRYTKGDNEQSDTKKERESDAPQDITDKSSDNDEKTKDKSKKRKDILEKGDDVWTKGKDKPSNEDTKEEVKHREEFGKRKEIDDRKDDKLDERRNENVNKFNIDEEDGHDRKRTTDYEMKNEGTFDDKRQEMGKKKRPDLTEKKKEKKDEVDGQKMKKDSEKGKISKNNDGGQDKDGEAMVNAEETDSAKTKATDILKSHDEKENDGVDKGGVEEEEEDDEIVDEMMDFLNVDRKRSRRSTTTDSGLGDDDYRDSSPESDDMYDEYKDEDEKRRHSKDGSKKKHKGYRPSSRQVSREDEKPKGQTEKPKEKQSKHDTQDTDLENKKDESSRDRNKEPIDDGDICLSDEKKKLSNGTEAPSKISTDEELAVEADTAKMPRGESGREMKKDKFSTGKKLSVPEIKVDEVGDLETCMDYSDENIEPKKRRTRGRGKMDSTGQDKGDDFNPKPEICLETIVQHKEYGGSISVEQGECYVEENTEVMAADQNVEYMIKPELKFEASVNSDEYLKDESVFHVKTEIDEAVPQNELAVLTPNIEVMTKNQYLDISSEAVDIGIEVPNVEDIAQNVSPKEDPVDNNNDIDLQSAHILEKGSKNDFEDDKGRSIETLPPSSVDDDLKKQEEKFGEPKKDSTTFSFDSGIDNESIISDQSAAVSESMTAKSTNSKEELQTSLSTNEKPEDAKPTNKDKVKPDSDEVYLQNLKNEQKLQKLNLKYELDDTSSLDERVLRENEKNERKATLRKQRMVMDSDDEEDDTRSRSVSVHDDDYFASTESLGMGLSRESLAFSQFDLFRAEGIPEKDENLSRGSSRDAEAEDVVDDNLPQLEIKEQAKLDAKRFSEYSEDIESSELLSSDPEDLGLIVAKQAKEISEEITSLNQAWSETTSYSEYTESSLWTTDVDGISFDGVPDTVPVVASQVSQQQAVRDVSVVDQKENKVSEMKDNAFEEVEILPEKGAGERKQSASADVHHPQRKVVDSRPVMETNTGEIVEDGKPKLEETKVLPEQDRRNSGQDATDVKQKAPFRVADSQPKLETLANESVDRRKTKDESIEEIKSFDVRSKARKDTVNSTEIKEAPLSVAKSQPKMETKTNKIEETIEVQDRVDKTSADRRTASVKESVNKEDTAVKTSKKPTKSVELCIANEETEPVEEISVARKSMSANEENVPENQYIKTSLPEEGKQSKDVDALLRVDADVDVESTPYDVTPDLELQVTSDVSSASHSLMAPKILSSTSDVTINNGESIVLEWQIKGNPIPEIKLFKDGKPVDATSIFKEDDYVAMEILDALPEDSGCYEIHVTNALGTDIGMISVKVRGTPNVSAKENAESLPEDYAYPPEFSVAPSDTVIRDGRTLIVKASVKGNPAPRIQWFRAERQISGDGDIDIVDEGNYCCLVIPCPGKEHAGQYLCRAVNDLGVAETRFNLMHEGGDIEDEDTLGKETLEQKGQEKPKPKKPRKPSKPSAPNVQLEISESQGTLSRKFSLVTDFKDLDNSVELHKDDRVEVLDKVDSGHWLVKTDQHDGQICYVAPSVLEPCDERAALDSSSKGLQTRKISTDVETSLKLKEKKKQLVQDVVDTETDYICDLKDLIDNYIKPIREEDFPQALKTNEDDLFPNLIQIYKFHHKVLLPQLTECDEEPEEVAKIFLNKRESFSEYLPYLATRRKASEVLYDKEVQDFLKKYSESIGDPSNALEELLNRPVERVHEYIDLLKTLIKYTVAGGGDCTELIRAVQMLTDICREVENIMLLSNMEGYEGKIDELGPVLLHEKIILHDDSIQGVEEKPTEHHVFLFNDKLLVAKETEEMAEADIPKLKFDQVLELRDVDFAADFDEDDSVLALWHADKEDAKSAALNVSPILTLRARNSRAKQTLVRELQEAQQKLGVVRDKTNMPEHRKLSSKSQKVKVKTSTPKKKADTKGVVDNESDRSSDDFNLINVDNYLTPEFEDGTTRPMFKKKLQKTIISENSTARLQCTVVGIPHPKVLWLKNNRPLKSSDRCRVITDGDLHILEFPEAKLDDSGLYTARAMNVNGSTISTAELLVGNVQPSSLKKYHEGMDDSEYQTPAYFFQMNNCQVEEGRLARFDCRVVAYPKPDIVWMKDGKVVEPDNRYKLLNFNDEIYSLLIQDVEVNDTGRYTCWAHNKYGEAMTEAYLNVIALEEQLEDTDIAPKFLTKFYDQTVNEDVPMEFQCMIAGKPKPAVRWLLDEIEIKPTENIKITYEENLCSLLIKEAKMKDSGNYSCHIKNSLGEATCTAGLTVLDDKVKGVPMLPKFLKRIGDVTAHGGDEIIYEVVVVGEPRPKVSWLYNHKPISETHRRFKMSHDGDIYRLHMSELCTTDEGKVTCKAVNSEGEVYCSSQLTVKRPPQEFEDKPAFKQKDFDAKYGCPPTFMKRIDDMYSAQGKAAKFECKVMGIPEPVVTWVKDGRPLAPGSKYWINRDGGHCSLTIRDVSPSDVGVYTCSVANAAGEVSCVANLKLESAKEISLDRDQFGRRLSRDSIRSDGSHAVPTLPYDKPSLSDIREESVRLSWLPAYTSNLPQDARNVKYMVEARELPGFEWNKMAAGIHGNTYLVKGLKPNSEYAFRVRAENLHGSSDATQPCMLTREKPAEEDFMQKISIKAPEFKRPPKLPVSKPVVTELGEETVRLAWKPAVAPPTAKKTTPISYRLEAQELPSSDWLPLASRLRDTTYYLPELQSDRDYNIRVRAENKYGLSEPTEPIWIPRATSFPGVPIKRPEIVDIEPTMARVRWSKVEVPTFTSDDEPLLYMLEMQAPPDRDWREVARDIRSSSHVVTDLKPGQDYRFRVKARSPIGAYSEPSPVTSLYRTLATSLAPIDRLDLEEAEPDFEGVRLAWNRVDVPPFHSDEEPLMYMIEMSEPPIDEWRPLVSGLPTTRYRVTDLTPDRDYKFRVRAVTPYGVTPPSYTLPVSYRRPSPVPTRALSEVPQLLYDETDALKLSWRPPTVETKRPIKYQVQMQTPQSLTWKPLASGIPDTNYRIRGLGPSRDYTFRVVPETSIGPLEPLPPVSLTSLPAPRTMLLRRPEILDLEPESLTLSWERPLIEPGLPVSYRIDRREPPSLDWRPIATSIPQTRYKVTGLKPSRDYHFKVTPVTTIGDLEPLPHVTLTSLPVRPRFPPSEPRALEVSKDSVKLSWQPAEVPFFSRHKFPIRYSIDMRSLPNADWIPVTRSVADTTYVVKGLRSDTDYQFRVSAHTDYGTSEPSLPVTVYRRPVPVFPRREPIITGLTPDSIVLSWQPADIPGNLAHMPNVTYRIEVQDPPEIGQWRPLISNLSRTTYHVTGLRPEQDYLFRVRAQTDGLTTEPTMPVYLSRRAGPPRMPREEPFIFEVHPESVKLQWRSVELPSRITDYSPVTYRLEMQELPRSDWTTLARGIPHTDFHVTNLHPDKEYHFRIRAENEMGIGEPTPPVSLKKRAVAPTMPQDEPLIYDVSPNGMFRLSWRPADLSSCYYDGSPVTYTIYVQEPPSNAWRPLVRRIPHTSYHVTSLRPNQDYSFRIQAENEYGVSRPTLPVRLIRHTAWRAPIDIPEISDIDEESRSLRLQWRPRMVSPFDKTTMKYHVESWEPRGRKWQRVASGLSDTSYHLTGLPFDQEYLFRVRAEAASLLSEPTYPVSLSRFRLPPRLPIYRPQIYDVEPDSVRLSWQPVHLPHRDPIRLPRRYHLELRELPSYDWRPVAHDIADTHYRVTGLRPHQDYEFRVRGLTDEGPTEYTTPVPLYRRAVIPHLPLESPRISAVDEDFVELRWRLVDIPATAYDEKPLSFVIEAQRPPHYEWSPVARNVLGDRYRVSGLQRHQDYIFRIRAEYPSGLSEPSPVIPVYRRPSESISVTYIPSRGRSVYSDYHTTPRYVSHSMQEVETHRKNAALVSGTNTTASKGSPVIKSKTDFFLAEMKRLTKRGQDIKDQIHKYRMNALKPSQTAKAIKEKFTAEVIKDAASAKPPPSPRSRRDRFLAEKKLASTKIQAAEKKPDFGKALDKFREYEVTRPYKPMEYQRDYSRDRQTTVETNLPRKHSLDSKKPHPFSAINPSLMTTYDVKPAPKRTTSAYDVRVAPRPTLPPKVSSVYDVKTTPKLTSSATTRKFLSLAADDSLLGRSRSMSITGSDLSFKKRHLVPDRLKYRQVSSDFGRVSSYSRTTQGQSYTSKYAGSKPYDIGSRSYFDKYSRSSDTYSRPHSWSGGERNRFFSKFTTKTTETFSHKRSTSVSDVRDFKTPSLSRIGLSVYHDLYSHSGSRVRGDSQSERGYNDYPNTRSTRSMSRSDLSTSRFDMSRASVPRSFAPLSKQPSLPNLGVSESISDIMNRYLKSGTTSRSRERTPPVSSRRFGMQRSGSFSTDGFTMKSRSDSISYPSFSRSPSFSTRRSPSMAKTLLDNMSGVSRSGSLAESGYLSIKSRTPSFPQNTYEMKSRSRSVAQGEYEKFRSGSVPESGRIIPKPRSSSAIITGLPPIAKAPGSPSSRRKDVSVSYTSYLPKTKQSMSKKQSGSRDSLLSGESTSGRTGSPVTTKRDAAAAGIRTSSVGGAGKDGTKHGKGLSRVAEQASGGPKTQTDVTNKADPEVDKDGRDPSGTETDKPSWLRTPTLQSQKHLA